MIGVAYLFGWYASVVFVSICSIYANFTGHLAAWRSDANPNAEQLQRIEDKLDRILLELRL